MPDGRWEFDDSVAAVFDDMLARSVPQLGQMRDLVLQMGSRFVQPQSDIVDLGCSQGGAMAPLIERFGSTNRFVGVEMAPPMLAECRERFKALIASGTLEVRDDDLKNGYPPVKASLTLSVLTLQFIPIEYRLRILADVVNHTVPGGGLVLVEKVLGSDAKMDTTLVAMYHAHKRAMGYSQEEIDRKRLSLEGVMVPLPAAWNEDLLRKAGFTHVECFWRCLNFCGWIAS
jgi:tRNA (cmo5U34)-methyltransferase